MEHETNRRFEAWLDDERCVISFHSIPDARYCYCAGSWQR